jgi:hypothetical protein
MRSSEKLIPHFSKGSNMQLVETAALRGQTDQTENHKLPPHGSTLEEVLSYQHPDLIARFVEEHHVPESYAQELFAETKKWLWLCNTNSLEGAKAPLIIYPFMGALDEMWHSFILFSKDYATFCNDFFGEFIHHSPTPAREKAQHRDRLAADEEGLKEETHDKLLMFVNYVEQKLGQETAIRWFGPEERLSTQFLRKAAVRHQGEFWEDRITDRLPYWNESRSIECDTPLMSEVIAQGGIRRSLIVGFANFADSLALASQGIKVVGVDVSAAGVETYRRAAHALSLAPRILGSVADIRHTDLSDLGAFDLIACTMMLHVLEPSERTDAVRKLTSAAGDTSRIIVTALSDKDDYLDEPSQGISVEELRVLFEKEHFRPETLEINYIGVPHSHPGGVQHAGHHVIQGIFRKNGTEV